MVRFKLEARAYETSSDVLMAALEPGLKEAEGISELRLVATNTACFTITVNGEAEDLSRLVGQVSEALHRVGMTELSVVVLD